MNQEVCEKAPKRISLSLTKNTDMSASQRNISSCGSEFNQQQATQSTDDNFITAPIIVDRSDMDIDSEDQMNDSLMTFTNGNTSQVGKSLPNADLERIQTATLDNMDEDFVDDKSVTENSSGTLPNEVAGTPKRSKMVGEDVFTEACVKTWQGSRIKAWEHRYLVSEKQKGG